MSRAFLTAALAAAFTHVDGALDAALTTAIWAVCWAFTTDPLPAAVRQGLADFAREYRR